MQTIHPSPRHFMTFRSKIFLLRSGVVNWTHNLKLEVHPLSAVRDCLFYIYAATIHVWRPSPPSASRRHHAVVTRVTAIKQSRVTLRLTVSQSVSLGVEPKLGLLTRYIYIFFKLQSCLRAQVTEFVCFYLLPNFT
jgi:hypothetical protein